MSDRKYCLGCRDDFYNSEGSNIAMGGCCWMRKTAKVVKRFEIGTWIEPTQPFAFREVKTHSCYHKKGSGFYDKLPDFVDRKQVNWLKGAKP